MTLRIEPALLGWEFGPFFRQHVDTHWQSMPRSIGGLGIKPVGQRWVWTLVYITEHQRIRLGSRCGYRSLTDARASMQNYRQRLTKGWTPKEVLNG